MQRIKNNGVLTILLILGVFVFYHLRVPPINPMEITNSNISSSDAYSHFLATQANQYSLLQIYLVVLGTLIAIAAFFGYSQLKNWVLKISRDTVKEDLPGLVKAEFLALAPEVQAQILAKTTLEEKEPFEKEFFPEGTAALFQDPMNIPDVEDKNL